MDMFRLDGETALITGGGGGIGYGVAETFVERGARVVLTGRNEEKLQKACQALGPAASYELFDVTDFDRLEGIVDGLFAKHGFIGILVNNAGNHNRAKFEDTTLEDLDRVLKTHLYGAFGLSRLFIPRFKEAGRGSILFMASMATYLGIPLVSAYAAAKGAYHSLVFAMSGEAAEYGVRVNAIAPGWIETDMFERTVKIDPPRMQKILSRTPMKKFGKPADIGNAAAFLCSPAAGFITGVILPVDGGALHGF